MRVFLSYAGEDRLTAERIAHSIRARKHDVFFDKHDLPPGTTYEDKIEAAVNGSDVFVFLISPHSVEPGSFTLTELDMAQRKWKRPNGRVLPVMIAPVPFELIPAYGKAVTVFEPVGDVAAETAIRVQQMRGFPWRRVGYAAAVVILGGAGVLGVITFLLPRPRLAVETQIPWPWERRYFGEPGEYKIAYKVKNDGNAPARLVGARLRVQPSGGLEPVGAAEQSATAPVLVRPADEHESYLKVTPKAVDLSQVKWSVCVTDEAQAEICSPEAGWSTRFDFSPASAFEVPEPLSQNAVAVARYGEHFALLSKNPGAVHAISSAGKVLASRQIEGEPTALFVDTSGVYVGTRGPDAVIRLSGEKFSSMQRMPVAFPATIRGAFGDPVSNSPASIARGGNRLWIVTRGGASGSGLMHVGTDMTDQKIPSYYDKISSYTGGMVLSSNGTDVWGSVTNVTPASLYRFTPGELKTYDGHDYDIASCASGILVRASDLLVPGCDGWVHAVREADGTLQIVSRVGNLLGYKMNAGTWTTVHMRPMAENGIAFLVRSERTAGRGVSESIVSRVKASKGLAMPLDVKNISIVDLAAQNDVFMVILDDGAGRRQTLALRYE